MALDTDKSEGEFKWIERKFDVDIHRVNFELDALQQHLLQRYLRQDKNFLRAWNTNYTPLFMEFFKDKVRLNEPITLSIMGATRSAKSTSGITLAGLGMEARGRLMTVDKVCASEYVFLEEIKKANFGDFYVIDESKQAMFGVGSMTRKFKIQDVQNIIAVNNISTIWIRPDKFSFEGAQYGLRSFGRGQFYTDGTKTPIRLARFMLYNLQESSAGGSLPLGMIYIPHFIDTLQNGKKLWKEYSAKKQAWVDAEVQGNQDTLINQVFRVAEKIWKYEKFKVLKKKAEKTTFITALLGNEAGKQEVQQVVDVISLLEKGFTLEEIQNFNKVG